MDTWCFECLQHHFSDHDSCPTCRRMIPPSDRKDLKCNIILRETIERVYPEQVEANVAENGHISKWDVSSVTSMKGLLKYKSDFIDNINSWDTSKVTTMDSMLREASTFNQPVNSWDTSKVTDMSYMFSGASAFNQPVDSWDTSKV